MIRFKHSSRGYRQILRSAPVAAVVHAKAEQVAAEVRRGYDEPDGWEIVVDSQIGNGRARSIVSGIPLYEEFAERKLVAALGAAR